MRVRRVCACACACARACACAGVSCSAAAAAAEDFTVAGHNTFCMAIGMLLPLSLLLLRVFVCAVSIVLLLLCVFVCVGEVVLANAPVLCVAKSAVNMVDNLVAVTRGRSER